MKLSIIIPCYNEAETIALIIEAVQKCPYEKKELIIVDDFSTDGSREILKKYDGKGADRIFYHEKNQGKGASLRTGIKAATGDIVIIQDADLEYDPKDMPKVIQPILDGRADVVYGSRFLGGEAQRVLYFWHRVGNTLLTTFSNMVTNINLTDMETCYKAFKREVIQGIEIEEDRFGFEPEITAKVAGMKYRIYEVGISYHGRTYEEGKKIGWQDGISALRCIIKYGILKRSQVSERPDNDFSN